MHAISDRRLLPIAEKVVAGERLGFDDGVALYESHDLPAIGWMANQVRERMHGDKTYFNINLHINPTNACFASCRFCAFGRKAFDEKSYILSAEEIVARARQRLPEGATEIHLVGGIDPRLKIDFYCGYIRALKEAFPHIHIKTLTPVEVEFIARKAKRPIREIIELLRDAGMDSMPGGGAEIFDEEVRGQICEHKCDSSRWFETHREMHRLGLRTNCTMLIGHVEQARHRVDHLMRLRAHQDEWANRDADGALQAGFQCFIPLSFHPKNTALSHLPGPTGFDELRNMAVCRLMLDNIPHIKAYWIMLGIKQAQVAQWFGANDIDGTVVSEEIYHDAGATTPLGMTPEDIQRIVRDCGRTPVLRDSVYNEIQPTTAAG